MPENLAKIIFYAGVFLIFLSGIVYILGRVLPLGKLPGDIFIQKENFTFYFPVVTMIILSILLSIIMNLLRR